jgi:outer membrane protein OmpA-like peptidoglycan-associated protein
MKMRFAPLLSAVLVLTACSFVASSGPPYLVYFSERSAQLDAKAHDVVALAAQRANEAPAARVKVIGYTDSAGSPAADVLLSQKRAQAVADALVANGVVASRLDRVGAGQTNEDPGIASRRVEITIGGG